MPELKRSNRMRIAYQKRQRARHKKDSKKLTAILLKSVSGFLLFCLVVCAIVIVMMLELPYLEGRMMWNAYLQEREIQLESLERLDLFYTLSEFLIVLQPDKSLVRLIGKNLENSVKMCLEKLVEITKRLERDQLQSESFN